MSKNILTLDTLEPDRDFIVVNKTPYYLRNDEELSLTQIARLNRLSKTVLDGGLTVETTDEEILAIEGYANEILGMIVIGLPDAIRDLLTVQMKFSIVRAFTTAASARRAAAQAGKEELPTADSSSQGSSGSTEAPSSDG